MNCVSFAVDSWPVVSCKSFVPQSRSFRVYGSCSRVYGDLQRNCSIRKSTQSAAFRRLEVRNLSSGVLRTLRYDQDRKGSSGRRRILVRAKSLRVDGDDFAEEEKRDGASSDDDSEGGGLSGLPSAVSSALVRFLEEFSLELRNETGFDSRVAIYRLLKYFRGLRQKSREALSVASVEFQAKFEEATNLATSAVLVFRHRYWPQFVNWNRIELWQDRKQWDLQRTGALIVYVLLVGAFLRGAHMILLTPRLNRKSLTEFSDAYLESIIPVPTPANVRKFRKRLWQETVPEGVSVRKYTLGEDGKYERDLSFVGDNPEENLDFTNPHQPDDDISPSALKLIDEDEELTPEQKERIKREIKEAKKAPVTFEPIDEKERFRVRVNISEAIDALEIGTPEERELLKQQIAELKASGFTGIDQEANVQGAAVTGLGALPKMNWQERLIEWEKIIREDRELFDPTRTKFVVDLNEQDIGAQIEKAKQEESHPEKPLRAFWVARTWWKYRPKLPYTYLLEKVKSQEVEGAVYTEDMKKLFVKMKEGFPSEFVVDLPVDPTLMDLLEASGVEVDILHRSDLYYYGRILLCLAPSVLIIQYIRGVVYRARERASEKIYDLLSMNRQHLILPEDAADKAKSQYKDVVVGGDVWQVIDEIMIYMRDPMKYYNKEVKLPRGILISGPPGTGKTLLARAIARESGLPFIFASGAEFVESSSGTGTDKVFDVFFTARANAPSFVFIDEIDALAGKNAEDDAERRATFEQLLSELDGEPEDTDVDRFSRRQAVILICATNRPDELDKRFMRPGRIDREIYIGLPGEEERISIFEVHSQGKRFAKDVDFSKLAFRTIGYSGADIRNLINEAGIMAVRKGHEVISQQDLVEVLDKQLFEGMGVVLMDDEQKRAEQKIPEENKRLLAVHEAGHVVLAHLFPRFDWHAFSHLLPGGTENALSVFYPREEMLQRDHTTVGYVMMQMVVAHGGRCAEQLVFGDNISDGGQDDLAKISSMARELTISPANSRFGLLPMKWRNSIDPPKPPGEIELIPNEWEKPGTQIVNMTVEFSELFTREVTKYVDDTEEIAMTALSQNRHILDKLADVLLKNTKLSGLEAGDIIKSMNPVLLPDFMDSSVRLDLKNPQDEVPTLTRTGRYGELDIYPAPLHQC